MNKQKQKKRINSIQKKQNQFYSSDNAMDHSKRVLSLRQIKYSYSTLPINPQNKLHANKTQIINKLSSHFRHKIQMDLYTRDAIQSYQSQKVARIKHIQKELEVISMQNQLKLKQLDNIQKKFIKKMQLEIKKDKQLQGKWFKQYQKLATENQKLKLTEQVKKIKQKEDWILIEKEQKRLELLARNFQNRQFVIGRDKSHIPKPKRMLKKNIREEENMKSNKSAKKERKKKNASELKQQGRLFLQHAKKVQAQRLKANTNVLDVYKKSIDYLPEIKTIIKSNVQDLSKPIDQNQLNHKIKRKRNSPSKLSK